MKLFTVIFALLLTSCATSSRWTPGNQGLIRQREALRLREAGYLERMGQRREGAGRPWYLHRAQNEKLYLPQPKNK